MALFTTPPLSIIDLPADSRHHSGPRGTWPIKYVVLHTTQGIDSRKWLSTDPASDVSAHRLMQRGPYDPITKLGGHYKILPDNFIANHTGFGTVGNYKPGKWPNLNAVSLGVELEQKGNQQITDYQYEQISSMYLEWAGLYYYPSILLHRDVDPERRTDPVNFDLNHFWYLVDTKRRAM